MFKLLHLFHTTFILLVSFNLFSNTQDSTTAQKHIDKGWSFLETSPYYLNLHLDSALIYIDSNKHHSLWASYLNKKGAYYAIKGESRKALFFFLKGLDVRKKNNLKSELIKSLNNIGTYYLNNDNDSIAIDYFRRALKKALNLGDSENEIKIYNNIGIIFKNQERYDSAIFYHKKSLEQNQINQKPVSSDLLNISSTYLEWKKYDSALLYAFNTIPIAQKESNYSNLGKAHHNLGNIYSAFRDYPKTLRAFSKSDSIAIQNELLELEIDSKYSLYEIHYEQKNYKNAITYLEQYIDLELEIQQKSKDKTLLELQTKFETQEKVNEINLLKKDNEIQTQTLNQLYLTSGILLLLLLILGVFYALFRQRQKTKNLEQQKRIDDLMRQKEMERVNAMLSGQENERKRIAEALHDQIGSLLSTVKHYLSSLDKKDKHELITKAELQLDNAVEEMRRISQNLVSGVLVKFGLIAAVKELANTIRDSGTLDIKVISTGFDERLNSDMEIYVYRILQELISNALKHAKAQSIVIRLKQEKENILLIIKDDGIGFSPQSIDKNKTTGLNNIIQRVELKKGRIKIDSESQKGTTIGIEMPYQ